MATDQPTPAEMTAALSSALGRLVEFHETPLADVEAWNPDLAAMYRFLGDHGYGVDIPALKARFPEVRFLSFANWANAESRA